MFEFLCVLLYERLTLQIGRKGKKKIAFKGAAKKQGWGVRTGKQPTDERDPSVVCPFLYIINYKCLETYRGK